MKIYTRTGDRGETSLVGGQRVPKDHLRIDAYGTVDELNSLLGLAAAVGPAPELATVLERLQNELFVLGADLATPPEHNSRVERISSNHIQRLEHDIDRLESSLESLKSFILPGGSTTAAYLHLARTVCRRAERICFSCRQTENISGEAMIFLNRLSDLLFIMARYQNKSENVADVPWNTQ